MDRAVPLSIVVAVQHAQANLPDVVAALDPRAHPDVEFLFGHTPDDPETPRLVAGIANVRVLPAASGSPIPHLWRDGILAARGARVATTTAACVPAPDWVARLLAADFPGCAGVGGTIGNDPASDALDWAVYLLRYAAFAPPRSPGEVAEIAADNALYRREEILREADLLDHGFWEPAFHARFRARGLGLRLDPTLRVTQRNRYTARQFLAQRRTHGRAFGRERACGLAWPRRLLLAAASPLLPLVFLSKIVQATRGRDDLAQRLPRAAPWLALFLLGWGLGEARGYLDALAPQGRALRSKGPA